MGVAASSGEVCGVGEVGGGRRDGGSGDDSVIEQEGGVLSDLGT